LSTQAARQRPALAHWAVRNAPRGHLCAPDHVNIATASHSRTPASSRWPIAWTRC